MWKAVSVDGSVVGGRLTSRRNSSQSWSAVALSSFPGLVASNGLSSTRIEAEACDSMSSSPEENVCTVVEVLIVNASRDI